MAPKYMAAEFGELELVSVGGGVAVPAGVELSSAALVEAKRTCVDNRY